MAIWKVRIRRDPAGRPLAPYVGLGARGLHRNETILLDDSNPSHQALLLAAQRLPALVSAETQQGPASEYEVVGKRFRPWDDLGRESTQVFKHAVGWGLLHWLETGLDDDRKRYVTDDGVSDDPLSCLELANGAFEHLALPKLTEEDNAQVVGLWFRVVPDVSEDDLGFVITAILAMGWDANPEEPRINFPRFGLRLWRDRGTAYATLAGYWTPDEGWVELGTVPFAWDDGRWHLYRFGAWWPTAPDSSGGRVGLADWIACALDYGPDEVMIGPLDITSHRSPRDPDHGLFFWYRTDLQSSTAQRIRFDDYIHCSWPTATTDPEEFRRQMAFPLPWPRLAYRFPAGGRNGQDLPSFVVRAPWGPREMRVEPADGWTPYPSGREPWQCVGERTPDLDETYLRMGSEDRDIREKGTVRLDVMTASERDAFASSRNLVFALGSFLTKQRPAMRGMYINAAPVGLTWEDGQRDYTDIPRTTYLTGVHDVYEACWNGYTAVDLYDGTPCPRRLWICSEVDGQRVRLTHVYAVYGYR